MTGWNVSILQTKRKQSSKIGGIERERRFEPTGVNQSWQRKLGQGPDLSANRAS
jgi:hypothetical protein